MTHKTISEKSIAVMSDLLIYYFNDGNPIEKSSDLDGILTIFAMAGTNLEIDARQSAAAEMRARCAQAASRAADYMLAQAIRALPLDPPTPEQEQATK